MSRKSFLLFLVILLFLPNVLFAQAIMQKHTPKDKSPKEVMRYINEAVKLVQEKGEDSYEVLTDPNGPWADEIWYLYINNFKGEIVAHLNKKLVGKNMFGVRDSKGNDFYSQFQANARSKRGYGWTEFWWPKPNSTTPSQKLGFVMRVPGRDVWVGTGIYDMSQEDIDKVLKENLAD